MFVAALDLGTTGCRTFIYNLAGEIIGSDYQEWQSFYPSPSFVEQDADVWWESIKKTIERAIKKFVEAKFAKNNHHREQKSE